MKRLTIRLRPEVYLKLKAFASKNNMSLNEAINYIIDRHLSIDTHSSTPINRHLSISHNNVTQQSISVKGYTSKDIRGRSCLFCKYLTGYRWCEKHGKVIPDPASFSCDDFEEIKR